MKTLDDIKLEIRNKFPSMNVIENGLADLIVDYIHDQGLLMVWQPIETAPKDGTPFIGWCKEWTTPICCWWYTGSNKWNTAFSPTAWTPLSKVGE